MLEHKQLAVKIQDVNEQARTFWAVGSTETRDRQGDIVHADGWLVDNFLKNPVIPWAHDYSQPPVANVEEIKVEGGRLLFKAKFPSAEDYPFADVIYRLYKGGFLRAFSVGFDPLEAKNLPDGGMEYFKQELYEVSAVVLPANPEALVGLQKAVAAGSISEVEAKDLEVEGLRAQLKALSGGQPQQDIAELAEAIDQILDKKIAGIVEAKIKYHLGVVD